MIFVGIVIFSRRYHWSSRVSLYLDVFEITFLSKTLKCISSFNNAFSRHHSQRFTFVSSTDYYCVTKQSALLTSCWFLIRGRGRGGGGGDTAELFLLEDQKKIPCNILRTKLRENIACWFHGIMVFADLWLNDCMLTQILSSRGLWLYKSLIMYVLGYVYCVLGQVLKAMGVFVLGCKHHHAICLLHKSLFLSPYFIYV